MVDAFASECFRGNPAAVFIAEDDTKLCDEWMQTLAAEMNLSETAFVQKLNADSKPGNPHWSIRWMTPTVEVALCGHATLAAAWSLLEQKHVAVGDRISFHSRKSGVLTAEFKKSETATKVVLDFPSDAVIFEKVSGESANAVARIISGQPSMTAAKLGIEKIGVGRYDQFVVLKDDKAVRGLCPDFALMRALPYRGITVTALSRSDPTVDFVSRFFGPQSGIDEDPVTGSAHCTLFTYWWPQLSKRSEGTLRAFQASKRGGYIDGSLLGDRVKLAGVCTSVWRGALSSFALKNHRSRL